MSTHELKTTPHAFADIIAGLKHFEYRWDDRDFQVGDHLVLKEFDPANGRYTGQQALRTVSYLLLGGQYGIPLGFVVMGMTDPTAFRIWPASREAAIQALRDALTEQWTDTINCRSWREDVLLTGCRKVGGGKGYEKPEEAASNLAGQAADAVLKVQGPERAWLPMETAPINGPDFIAVNANGDMRRCWRSASSRSDRILTFNQKPFKAIGWAPLSFLPSTQRQEADSRP